MAQRAEGKGEVTCLAVVAFQAELRLAIVGGIVATEEIGALYAIELQQVALDMGAEHVVGDATPVELANGFGDGLLIFAEEYVVGLLRTGIVALQPIAFVAPLGRTRQVVAQHDLLQRGTGTGGDGLRGVDDTARLTTEPGQRVRQASHGENGSIEH